MKRKYEKPMAYEEVFSAENYCTSACYYLTCDYGVSGGTKLNGYHNSGSNYPSGISDTRYEYHSKRDDGSGCGHKENQVFRTESNGSTSIYEVNAQGITHDLLCTIVQKNNNTVYWTTTAKDTNNGRQRLWAHKGTIGKINASHPNMS